MNANEQPRHSLQPVMKIKQHTYYILRGVDILFIKTYGYEPADQQIRTKSRYCVLGCEKVRKPTETRARANGNPPGRRARSMH
jgi:hypothetical protein